MTKVAEVISLELARRKAEHRAMVDAIQSLFDIQAKTWVKTSEAYTAVSGALRKGPSNELKEAIKQAFLTLGVVTVKSGGYTLFRGARLKGTEGLNPHTQMTKERKKNGSV